MDQEDRDRLALLIKEKRLAKFKTVTAAIRAAEVNTETWNRTERGEVVRDDRLAAVLEALWPESGGAWWKLLDEDGTPASEPTTVGAGTDDGDTLLFRRPPGLTDAEWEQLRADQGEYWQWRVEKAAGER